MIKDKSKLKLALAGGIAILGVPLVFLVLLAKQGRLVEKGLNAYRNGECDIAIMRFREARESFEFLNWIDRYNTFAKNKIEECETYTQSNKYASQQIAVERPDKAWLSYANFLTQYDDTPLADLTTASIAKLLSDFGISNLISLDSCEESKLIVERGITVNKKENISKYYWNCGTIYLAHGQRENELDSYINFFNHGAHQTLESNVKKAIIGSNFACENSSKLNNAKALSNGTDFRATFHLICGLAFQETANYPAANYHYQSVLQAENTNLVYKELAENQLETLNDEITDISSSMQAAADSVREAAAICLGLTVFKLTDIAADLIEAISGKDCATGATLSSVERFLIPIPWIGNLVNARKIKKFESVMKVLDAFEAIQNIRTANQLERMAENSKTIYDLITSEDNQEILLANSSNIKPYLDKLKNQINMPNNIYLVEPLLRKEVPSETFLGINIRTVSLNNEEGILISNAVQIVEIVPNTPAQDAELIDGDLILEIDSLVVNDADQLISIISKKRIGQKSVLSIIRDGVKQPITVEFGSRRRIKSLQERSPSSNNSDISNQLTVEDLIGYPYVGVEIISLNPVSANEINQSSESQLNVPDYGIFIGKVKPNFPAEKAGLQRGDVIVQIDNLAIHSTNQVQQLIRESKINQVLNFKVIRNGRMHLIPLTIEILENSN